MAAPSMTWLRVKISRCCSEVTAGTANLRQLGRSGAGDSDAASSTAAELSKVRKSSFNS